MSAGKVRVPGLTEAIALADQGDALAWDHFAALREQARRDGHGDASQQVLLPAAALLVTGHHLWRFEPIEACIAELAPLREGSAGLSADDELLALNGLLLGLLLCHPRDPCIDTCAARVHALIDRGCEINRTLAAARTLIYHFDAGDLRAPAMRLHALISARFDEPAATPYRRAEWLNLWRRCAHFARQPQAAEQALAQMRALAREHGLRRIEFIGTLAELDTALPRGDVAAVLATIDRAEAIADPGQLREALQLESARTRLARMRGQIDTALHHAERARKLAEELHLPPVMLANFVVSEAQARLLGDDFEGARLLLHAQIARLPEGYADEVATMVGGVDTYLAVRDVQPDAEAALTGFWRGLRERRSYDLFEGFPEFGARLCVMALERNVETDFVRSLIGKCQLAAPEGAPESWPWPLRIRALGGFAVWRDDVLLAAEGKAQRKPLALLQTVIALGATREERGVEVGRLVDLLWSDEAMADPKSSFEAALSRLRRWLGVDGALKIADGRLSLNARLVRCDVDSFERLCDELQRTLEPHADAAALPRLLVQVGALYRGKLFGSATLEPWSVLARERLAMRFARAVADAGSHLETHQRWAEALRLYEESLVQDLLAEPIHRALMRCHVALGQPAEARRVFERCKAVLRAELGLTPGAETLRLLERIGGER